MKCENINNCMKTTRLLIAIPSNTGRMMLPVQFTASLVEMLGNIPDEITKYSVKYFGGLRIDSVRLQMVEWALSHNYDYILMLDDDMVFPSNMIAKMWLHVKSGLPIISGVYHDKQYPFKSFINPIECTFSEWLSAYEPKLYQVKMFGTGCLMINTEIFEHLHQPYFLLRMDKKGRPTTTEDCYFAMNCYINGINAYVDGTIVCEHIITTSFPNLFSDPYITFRGALDKRNGIGNISIKPRSPEKLNSDLIPVPVHNLFWLDGVDDCSHQTIKYLPVNDGQRPIYRCEECGLISQGVSTTDYLEENVKKNEQNTAKIP